MGKRLTTKEFIKRAKKIHGNKYDYSKVKYITSKDNVIIKCKIHKEFEQIPNSHLRGRDCEKCSYIFRGNKSRSTTEEFIKKAIKVHGDKYDYSKTDFKISKIKVTIICKKCNKSFKQFAHNHLSGGYGCIECGNQRTNDKLRLTTKEFIKRAKKIHKNKYDYSKVNYKKANEKIVIICKKCNKTFSQKAYSHLEGRGCPMCKKKNEGEVGKLLKKCLTNFIIIPQKFIYKYIGMDNKNHKRYCDFWLEKDDIKIIVEYDGSQHYMPVKFYGISLKKANKNFKRQQYIDKNDKNFCLFNNILLWRVKYNENKKESILQLKNIIKDVCFMGIP